MARRTATKDAQKGQYRFAEVPAVEIPRSTFNRSHSVKTTFNSGVLVPILADEMLPGDTFKLRQHLFGRMATPIYPVMDNFFLDSFYFAVPVRLIWDNWEKFNGAQDDPGDTTDFLVPTMTEDPAEMSLSDYLGIPVGAANPLTFSSLWHRAYNLIFKEWFRSEDLTDSPVVDRDDGPDDPADYTLLRRTKRHDYFSAALPFAQKGPAVPILFEGVIPVVPNAFGQPTFTGGGIPSTPLQATSGTSLTNWNASATVTGSMVWNSTGLEADLASATSNTINQLREAFQIQRLLERDARGGTRYTEILRSHFRVTSPDMRTQRPEYLGGSSSRINVTPVARTVPADTVGFPRDPLGALAGFATMSSDGPGFVYSATEHVLILGLVNVRADITYQQGLERQFSRSSRYDFYWPAFAHLGEQEVLNKEIYAQGIPGTLPTQDEGVFGYQERYAEYRYKPNRTCGQFRSSAVLSLDAWHLGLDFSSLPVLNNTFIEDNPPFARVLAITNASEFILDAYFDYNCARPMPVYSVPGLIDHF